MAGGKVPGRACLLGTVGECSRRGSRVEVWAEGLQLPGDVYLEVVTMTMTRSRQQVRKSKLANPISSLPAGTDPKSSTR